MWCIAKVPLLIIVFFSPSTLNRTGIINCTYSHLCTVRICTDISLQLMYVQYRTEMVCIRTVHWENPRIYMRLFSVYVHWEGTYALRLYLHWENPRKIRGFSKCTYTEKIPTDNPQIFQCTVLVHTITGKIRVVSPDSLSVQSCCITSQYIYGNILTATYVQYLLYKLHRNQLKSQEN